MSASNAKKKDVLRKSIKVELWTDYAINACGVSRNQTSIPETSISGGTREAQQPKVIIDGDDEEQAIEVDENSMSNIMFSQSPDVLIDTTGDENRNVEIENVPFLRLGLFLG